jgi:hypothetical protein
LTEVVSDRPRDQEQDATAEPGRPGRTDPADAPVTGPPGDASGPADAPVTGPPGGAGAPAGATAARSGRFPTLREQAAKLRRRRRLFVWGIVAGAALVAIALCAGTVGVISAVDGFRDRSAAVREAGELRDADCLSLEQRLNRLVPPGATASLPARATAIRDENAAVRIYVNGLRDTRGQDGWRRLLDARTAYAEALDAQAKSRTPAFYVPPRAADGGAVSDQLVSWSPASCAGAVRRLAGPDL